METPNVKPGNTLDDAVCTMLQLYKQFMRDQQVSEYETIDTEKVFDWSHLV